MSENINILTCIISCKKNMSQWYRYETIDKSIIICGDNNLEQKYKIEYKNNSKILFLNCSDLYCGLCEKIIFMINSILELKEYNNITHIIKIDDDNIFNNENIESLYNYPEILNNYNYIGQYMHCAPRINNWHFDRTSFNNYWYNKIYSIDNNKPYLDGGESYILSRYAMNRIKDYYNFNDLSKLRKEYIYEDHMIGEILNYYKIYPIQTFYGIKGDKGIQGYIFPDHISKLNELLKNNMELTQKALLCSCSRCNINKL